MFTKTTILSSVGYYLPGYKAGGPIRTLANMVDRLGDEFQFKIVTLDRDFGDRLEQGSQGGCFLYGSRKAFFEGFQKAFMFNRI